MRTFVWPSPVLPRIASRHAYATSRSQDKRLMAKRQSSLHARTSSSLFVSFSKVSSLAAMSANPDADVSPLPSNKRPRLNDDAFTGLSQPPTPPPPTGIYLAPMVRGSELAMRELAHKHGGASLCYGPMLRDYEVVAVHELWQNQKRRPEMNNNGANESGGKKGTATIDIWSRDVPMDKAGRVMNDLSETAYLLLHDTNATDATNLVVQLCGSKPSKLGAATSAILDLYANVHDGQLPVGIDLNLGCPQNCADRGNFGAFLVERDRNGAVECIAAMRKAIEEFCINSTNNGIEIKGHRPRLSAKIRLLETVEATIDFCRKLRKAGCDSIAIHCRRRTDKHDGPPDWVAGAKLVAAMEGFPIILNGGILDVKGAQSVIGQTKCHAVMVAQGYLQNHRIFLDKDDICNDKFATSPAHLAAEYLEYAEQHPPPCYLYLQKHLRWIFRKELQPEDELNIDYSDWRPRLWGFLVRSYLRTVEQCRLVVALYVKLSMEVGCSKDSAYATPTSIEHLVKDVTFKSVKMAGRANPER